MDLIKIDNLEVYANHGVYEEENIKGQFFYLSLRLYLDFKAAAERDDLEKTVNYGEVCRFAADYMKENTFSLIETVADGIAEELLYRFPLLRGAWVEVKKPYAPVDLDFECISVCTERKWHRVFISYGSNMGNRRRNIEAGIAAMEREESIRVLKISELIETKPYGYTEQDDFLNGAAEIETILEPSELLRLLHEIEDENGRERTVHWGPRTLDMDIIFYDDLIMDSPELTIPHREMHLRDFVKIPLSEIAPDFVHPIYKKRICEL